MSVAHHPSPAGEKTGIRLRPRRLAVQEKGKPPSRIFARLDRKIQKELKTLSQFITIFCREKHTGQKELVFPEKDGLWQEALGRAPVRLCPTCARLLTHGTVKLLLCPHNPKPMCKKCPAPCYGPGYRRQIREVMRFSGLWLIKHGRFDLVLHYFF